MPPSSKPASQSPNIRRLAKLARVSHTTVSLALRNHPRVSEAQRLRIRALAEKMGYRPNALVSALMSHVRRNRRVVAQEVIGFLTGGPTPDWWQGWPSIRQAHVGARARAEELGFRLEPFWLGPLGKEARATGKVLHARAIRGAIIAPLPVPHECIDLNWSCLAATAIGYSFEQVELHRVTHHHVKSMLMTYDRLRQLGYGRIGLAMALEEMVRVEHYWLAGLLTGQKLFGGEKVPPLVFPDHSTPDRFFAWLKRERPDVVVGVGRDTFFWLKEACIRVPEQVAYAHLNLLDVQAGNIAGVEQNSAAIGAAATDLLIGQLYQNRLGLPETPVCTLIDGTWVPGASAPGWPRQRTPGA